MTNLSKRQEICLRCAQCCKKLVIPLVQPHLTTEEYDFYQTRGGHIIVLPNGLNCLVIDCPCPYLQQDNKCAIYDQRPQKCREHDGRNDPFLKDSCQWTYELKEGE